jgi:hypothetical protein
VVAETGISTLLPSVSLRSILMFSSVLQYVLSKARFEVLIEMTVIKVFWDDTV